MPVFPNHMSGRHGSQPHCVAVGIAKRVNSPSFRVFQPKPSVELQLPKEIDRKFQFRRQKVFENILG
jgi:hypothetical protein